MDSRFVKDRLKKQISNDVDHVEELSGAGLALNAVELAVLLFVIVAALVKSYTALQQSRSPNYNSSAPVVALNTVSTPPAAVNSNSSATDRWLDWFTDDIFYVQVIYSVWCLLMIVMIVMMISG